MNIYNVAEKTAVIMRENVFLTSIFFFKEVLLRESKYQLSLTKKLERMFPGVVILKNDAARIQGITDLLLLYKMKWAALEVKVSEDAPIRPNQEYWVEKLDELSFAAFIYPENEEEVLSALQLTFGR